MTKEDLFAKAVAFAAEKHKKQRRRDGMPYLFHLINVARIVGGAGYGTTFQVVAVLHDTLEDTDATEEEVAEFGDDVLTAVKLLTRPKGCDEKIYVRNILQNNLAAVVKAADKIDNVRDSVFMSEKDREFAERYILKKSMPYYYGAFNMALDTTLSWAKHMLEDGWVSNRVPYDFSKEEFRIYGN